MIIYPIIILVLLFIAFGIFWRRAYLVNVDGLAEREKSEEKDESRGIFNLLKFHKKASVEPEAQLETETDSNLLKADELFRKKQFISAEKWYLEAVRNNPKNPKIYSRLGIIYIEQKSFKDAIEALNEAIKLDPSVAARFFNLSFAFNSEGDKKQAMFYARRAVRLAPGNKKYRRWLEDLKIRGI